MNKSWESDTLDITVPITFEPGAAITSLTGGTVVAHASRAGVPVVVGVATIEAADSIRVVFAAGSLSPGVWQLQVRATVSGIVKTVVDTAFTIQASI